MQGLVLGAGGWRELTGAGGQQSQYSWSGVTGDTGHHVGSCETQRRGRNCVLGGWRSLQGGCVL